MSYENIKNCLISNSIPILRLMVLQNRGVDVAGACVEKGNQSQKGLGI